MEGNRIMESATGKHSPHSHVDYPLIAASFDPRTWMEIQTVIFCPSIPKGVHWRYHIYALAKELCTWWWKDLPNTHATATISMDSNRLVGYGISNYIMYLRK